MIHSVSLLFDLPIVIIKKVSIYEFKMNTMGVHSEMRIFVKDQGMRKKNNHRHIIDIPRIIF